MTDEATPATPHHKRLPGLWVVCALFGLGGVMALSSVLSATPLGVLWFGTWALVSLSVAAGLWVRWGPARLVAMGLTALRALAMLVAATIGSGESTPWDVPPFAAALFVLVYLWLRRGAFVTAPAPKPRLLSRSAGALAGVVLLLGGGWAYWRVVDDAPREFPLLAVRDDPIPDEDNAYALLRQMPDQFALGDYEELDRLSELYEIQPGRREDSWNEWVLEAAVVVDRWKGCQVAMDAVLARPHCVPPRLTRVGDLADLDTRWLSFARGWAIFCALASDVELLHGDVAGAIEQASRPLRLGLMLAEGSDLPITYLTGLALIHIGAAQVRAAADSPGMRPELLRPVIAQLDLTASLRTSIRRNLAVEFEFSMLAVRDTKALRFPDGAGDMRERPLPLGSRLLRDNMPFIKLNMCRNVLGDFLTRLAEGADTYSPPPTVRRTGPRDIVYITEEMDLIHLARNPLGDVMMSMLAPACERMVLEHHRALAAARLTQVFLAVRCYHLSSGHLPASLDGLAPAYFDSVPVDPFTDEPFGYDPEADMPVLYSVGPDLERDGPDDPDEPWEDVDDLIAELTFAARGDER